MTGWEGQIGIYMAKSHDTWTSCQPIRILTCDYPSPFFSILLSAHSFQGHMSWYSLAHARDFGPVHATAYGPHTVVLVTFFSIKVCMWLYGS